VSRPVWERIPLPGEAANILKCAPSVRWFNTTSELVEAACGDAAATSLEVAYEVPGRGRVVEATVARVRNGIAANYTDPYMRRRDPDCLVIADGQPTDKPTYRERFDTDFQKLRNETFHWLKTQPLAAFAFTAGRRGMGMDAVVIAPANAAFFALGLAMLQGIIPVDQLHDGFAPKLLIFVAPPFRHTHFQGRQVVVHNRSEGRHEMFSYNLYPGPSAKKGVYGCLIHIGEQEGWVTAHCSTVQVVTPYDNTVTLMHEGASGGGKSEMLEQTHREPDGRIFLGRNLVTHESRYLEIPRFCELRPVTDDMALCHPSLQQFGDGKLWVADAEDAWFVRVNHITEYATDPQLERLTAQPPEPLLFLNVDAVPGARAMVWEHIEDSPGKPCPNPRVIIPRTIVPGIVDEAVAVDIRSLGLRTPPCTKERPSYGILGIFHVLPPALAWLWRLVAPRGHGNPSIIDSEGLQSEGVGSYWPFATGRQVDQANLLLRQFLETPKTRHILVPNQHVGAWYTGFAPQWIAREYLARRGSAKFKPGQLEPSPCALLGHSLYQLTVEGRSVPRWFLQTNTQPEVGDAGFAAGAAILQEYFEKHLREFLSPELDPLGREIIEHCLARGGVEGYEALMPQG
jgi:hypothetical protein